MALVAATLASELTAAMSPPYPEDRPTSANRFGTACATYFGAATFPPTAGASISAAQAAFEAAFVPALDTIVPLRFTALELGLVAMVGVITAGVIAPDVATPPVGQPIITLSPSAPSAAAAAQTISVIVDTWARTGTFVPEGIAANTVPWS